MDNCFLSWWQAGQNKYQALLLDIDGTLTAGGHALPGAVDLIAWLRNHRFPFCLLTNDGNRSPRQKSGLLKQSGVEVEPEEIVSCGMALASFADDPGFRDQLFFVVGDLGDPCYAVTAGLQVTREPEKLDSCAGIVIGEGDYDWQAELQLAVNGLLRDPGKLLIVPNPDSYWPDGLNGQIGIGAGGKARFMVSILAEAGVNVEPVYLGKPYPAIFKLALELLRQRFFLPKLQEEQVLMLGDSLKSDIVGANRAGMGSGLLLTGITDQVMAKKAVGEEKPDLQFRGLS